VREMLPADSLFLFLVVIRAQRLNTLSTGALIAGVTSARRASLQGLLEIKDTHRP
jgi:hypothetical protein